MSILIKANSYDEVMNQAFKISSQYNDVTVHIEFSSREQDGKKEYFALIAVGDQEQDNHKMLNAYHDIVSSRCNNV